MQITKTGIIVFVEHYEECVSFYRDRLLLPITEVTQTLTTFAFGSAYLMVEQGGVSSQNQKSRAQNPSVLRFNVIDIQEAALELRTKGVPVEIHEFDWGGIGVFWDPDGNRCELKNAV